MYERNDRRDDRPVIEQRAGISPAVVGIIVLAILALIFIVQNRADTRVTFLIWDVDTSVWVAIVVALLIGMLLGRLLTMLRRNRRAD